MNQNILHFFNDMVHKSNIADSFVSFLIQWVPFIIAAVIVIIFIIGVIRKKEQYRISAVNAGCLVVLCLVLGFIIGQFVDEARPMFALTDVTVLLPHSNDSSFPSDHMLICFGASFGFFQLRKWFSFVLMGFGLLVGIAKIYAAQHYPSDIFLTILFVFIIYLLYRIFISKWVTKIYLTVEKRIFADAALHV